MISIKTLRNTEKIHRMGNIFRVVPIKLDIRKLGILGSSELIYKGWKWKLSIVLQILMRFVIVLGIVLQMFLHPGILAVEVVIGIVIMAVLLLSIPCFVTFFNQDEEIVSFFNKLLQLNGYLCTYEYLVKIT
jgi:hypothetical protein